VGCPDLKNELVSDVLLMDQQDLQDDALVYGHCSPKSANQSAFDEDWMGTENKIGTTALKNYKHLVNTYCKTCPARPQCYTFAFKSGSAEGVFAVHPKYRKKRVVKAQLNRTFTQMFDKLDRAFNNLGVSDAG